MGLARRFRSVIRRGLWPLAGVIIGATAVTAVSAHQGQVSGGVIHACVGKNNGGVRVIAASGACAANENALDWNAQGPTGPPGVSDREVVWASSPESNLAWRGVDVGCPAGKVALSGGYRVGPDSATAAKVTVWVNKPGFTAPSWQVAARVPNVSETAPFNWSITAYAVCATVQ